MFKARIAIGVQLKKWTFLLPDQCLLDPHFETDAFLSSQATLIVNSSVQKSQWDMLN